MSYVSFRYFISYSHRCVRFNPFDENEVYTVFRFVCGPMSIFDESRSVCTGPELADPPCSNEAQLATLFPQYSADTTTTQEPDEPSSTLGPEPISTIPPPEVAEWWGPDASLWQVSQDTTPEAIEGFIVVGSTDLFDLSQQGPLRDVDIPADTPWAIVSQGVGSVIIIQEEGAREGNPWTLPPGAILIAKPTQVGGRMTQVAHEHVTTPSTTTSFPPGTEFFIVLIGSRKQILSTRTLPTSVQTSQLTIPAPSLVGNVTIEDKNLIGIGEFAFRTRYVLNGPGGASSSYGILTSTKRNLMRPVISTSSIIPESDPEFISGLLAIGGQPDSDQYGDLTVPAGELVVIIPPTRRAKFSYEGYLREILPGSFIGIKPTDDGLVASNLAQQTFTTGSSNISFPALSQLATYRIGSDGRLVQVGEQWPFPLNALSTHFYTQVGSLVGIVKTDQDSIVTYIGKGSFSIQQLPGSPGVSFGLLNFNTPSVEAVVASNPTFNDVDSLSGFLDIGNPALFAAEEGPGESLAILADTTSAIVTSGEIQISEQDSKRTIWTVPKGSIMGIKTSSANGGQADGILKGYLTSTTSSFTFPAGATFGIIRIKQDGTMEMVNTYTTSRSTTVAVPAGSKFGEIKVSDRGVVTGIGSASFSKQQLLLGYDSVNPIVGTFGILQFHEDFQLASSAVISTPPMSALNNPQEILAGIVPVYDRSTESSSTTSTLTVPSYRVIAILPADGEVVVRDDASRTPVTLSLLPNRIFVLITTSSGGTITDVSDDFFTTSKTRISFGSGNTYMVFRISPDGDVILDHSSALPGNVEIKVAPGSIVGPMQTSGDLFSGIGRAVLAYKKVSSTVTVGLLDIAGFLAGNGLAKDSELLISSVSGPFSIDCKKEDKDRLRQFPLDCSRFYQCHDDAYIFSCAPGLVFDESLVQCVYPTTSRCQKPFSSEDLKSQPSDPNSVFKIRCTGRLLRYPMAGDCSHFYQCSGDDLDDQDTKSLVIFSCAQGLIFDEPSSRCLLPSQSDVCDISANHLRLPSMDQMTSKDYIRSLYRSSLVGAQITSV